MSDLPKWIRQIHNRTDVGISHLWVDVLPQYCELFEEYFRDHDVRFESEPCPDVRKKRYIIPIPSAADGDTGEELMRSFLGGVYESIHEKYGDEHSPGDS